MLRYAKESRPCSNVPALTVLTLYRNAQSVLHLWKNYISPSVPSNSDGVTQSTFK